MTDTIVTLTHTDINGGDPVQIYCTGVKVTINKNNDKKPDANYSDTTVARVNSISVENPKYSLDNVKLGMGSLTYANLLAFFKLPNDESDPILLNVTYGLDPVAGTYENLVGYDGVTTNIPVTFDGALSVPFDTKNSTNAYRPSFSINLVEVRV